VTVYIVMGVVDRRAARLGPVHCDAYRLRRSDLKSLVRRHHR